MKKGTLVKSTIVRKFAQYALYTEIYRSLWIRCEDVRVQVIFVFVTGLGEIHMKFLSSLV